jgi:hypothetical protein
MYFYNLVLQFDIPEQAFIRFVNNGINHNKHTNTWLYEMENNQYFLFLRQNVTRN